MTRVSSHEAEQAGIRSVAQMMAVAARTAPKGRGVDAIECMIVEGEELETIARTMEEISPGRADILEAAIRRDANNVRQSACVVLVGVDGSPKKPEKPLDCGACGFRTCEGLLKARHQGQSGLDYAGPVCAFASMDLGVALGSMVRVAADHGVDNRIMYTMGIAVKRLGWMESDIVIGVPLSASGKSIYFDRG